MHFLLEVQKEDKSAVKSVPNLWFFWMNSFDTFDTLETHQIIVSVYIKKKLNWLIVMCYSVHCFYLFEKNVCSLIVVSTINGFHRSHFSYDEFDKVTHNKLFCIIWNVRKCVEKFSNVSKNDIITIDVCSDVL